MLWNATNCLAHTDISTAIIHFWWEFAMFLEPCCNPYTNAYVA